MRMNMDEWEDLDGGKAIDLAGEIYQLRDEINQEDKVMENISRDDSDQPGKDEAISESYESRCETSNELSELEEHFRKKYGFDIDQLDIYDDDED